MSSSSIVTYTSVYTDFELGRVFWGADEELSDGGSPQVIVYIYNGLPMQPVAPPSPDYVPGPKHPLSPDYVPGLEHPPSPVENPIRISIWSGPWRRTSLLLSLWTGGDDDDEPPDDDDDTDDEDEEPFEDEDDDEEEHLALADSSAVPVIGSVPSAGYRALETDGMSALLPRSHQSKVPFAQTLHRRGHERLSDLRSYVTIHGGTEDIPEAELPPYRRLCLTAPTSRYEVGESSTATPRPTGGHRVDYGFIGTTDAEIRVRSAKEQDTQDIYALIEDGQDRQTYTNGYGDGSHNSRTRIRGTVRTPRECTYKDFLNCKPLTFKGTKGVVVLSQWFEKMESVFHISNCAVENQVKFATCTFLGNALTWWNFHMNIVTQDVAYSMDWKALKKMVTVKYCPRGAPQQNKRQHTGEGLLLLGLVNRMGVLGIFALVYITETINTMGICSTGVHSANRLAIWLGLIGVLVPNGWDFYYNSKESPEQSVLAGQLL
ncbi:hypothetical protein Tco_0349559 [Tanacetum coccineum]